MTSDMKPLRLDEVPNIYIPIFLNPSYFTHLFLWYIPCFIINTSPYGSTLSYITDLVVHRLPEENFFAGMNGCSCLLNAEHNPLWFQCVGVDENEDDFKVSEWMEMLFYWICWPDFYCTPCSNWMEFVRECFVRWLEVDIRSSRPIVNRMQLNICFIYLRPLRFVWLQKSAGL